MFALIQYHVLGLYNGFGDHYTHIVQNQGTNTVGLDLHHDVDGVLETVFSVNGTYSTMLYAEEAIKVIKNHDVTTVSMTDCHECPHMSPLGTKHLTTVDTTLVINVE